MMMGRLGESRRLNRLAALACVGLTSACGPSDGAIPDVEGSGHDGDPGSETANSCGSSLDRELANLAVAVAEETRRWNVGTDFELDPQSNELRFSTTGATRCVDGCPKTNRILDLQRGHTL